MKKAAGIDFGGFCGEIGLNTKSTIQICRNL